LPEGGIIYVKHDNILRCFVKRNAISAKFEQNKGERSLQVYSEVKGA
jgi:hypothetical protein